MELAKLNIPHQDAVVEEKDKPIFFQDKIEADYHEIMKPTGNL